MKGIDVARTLSILSALSVGFVTIHYKYARYQTKRSPSSTHCGPGNTMPSLKYVTQTAKFCEPAAKRPSVLIGVTSTTDHFEARAAIRDTWGGTALKMDFVVVFLLGKTLYPEVQRKVFTEQGLYGDIVQGDFLDTYRNLTYKTVMLIRWAREKCSGVNFVLKTDDDMLVSVWDLAVVVNGLEGVKRTMWGYLYRDPQPNRNVSSKWYVSRKEYVPDTYPPFLSGTGYLISGDSIAALEELTHVECFLPLEDIYLTAIVAERAQVSRLGFDGFSNEHKWFHKPCSTPRVVTSHGWSAAALRNEWSRAVSRLDFGLCAGIKKCQMVS
ncbi:beta-1,3-galactosyltransferase 5-like [Dermacentor variabilis]|uniref:beta-1,3-galactosyltransferase 5-like n=1 Tax=Dermacentor variabilis TaxID=34621 RepID=UPI003F5B3471